MTPHPRQVVGLVRGLVASPWPTSERERAAWFEQHGLPTRGRPDPAREPSRSTHSVADGPPGWGTTQWHFFDDAFVGLCWFLWFDEPEPETRAAADLLRQDFDGAWTWVDGADDPVQGYTGLWSAGEAQVDLYVHAPRVLPRGGSARGGAQLYVDHAARGAAEDQAARERSLGPGRSG